MRRIHLSLLMLMPFNSKVARIVSSDCFQLAPSVVGGMHQRRKLIQSTLIGIKQVSDHNLENRLVSDHDCCAMPTFSTFRSFEALDSCHQNIQKNLDDLTALAKRLTHWDGKDESVRSQAQAIETFFSTVARGHHAAEEQDVFPYLLKSDNADTVAQVRSLIEDHFWIEKYWSDLSPLLTHISEGLPLQDKAEFDKVVNQFLELCNFHISQEESMIYPEAKAQLSRIFGSSKRPVPPDTPSD
jgi:hemerythrin-like domain-containing protein